MENKKSGLYFVCDCGNEIPIGYKDAFQKYCWDASFNEYERFIDTERVCSISGVCPKCNKHFDVSIDI